MPTVRVKENEPFEVAMRRFKRTVEKTGLLTELRAREFYEKVLALNPRFAPAANNLAWILSEHGGDKDKALALAQTAKELAPEDAQVSDTLGWIFYRRGLHQRALALLKDSAAKLPGNPEVQYHLGMASAAAGDCSSPSSVARPSGSQAASPRGARAGSRSRAAPCSRRARGRS